MSNDEPGALAWLLSARFQDKFKERKRLTQVITVLQTQVVSKAIPIFPKQTSLTPHVCECRTVWSNI